MTPEERKVLAMLCLVVTQMMEDHNMDREMELLEMMADARLLEEASQIFEEVGIATIDIQGIWDMARESK